MGSTYLDLTNKLLRRLNEVTLTSSNFASAKGIHQTARDAIVDAVDHINNHRTNWPFNIASGSQVLTAGTEVYSWPADFASVDWESFQIEKDNSLNVNSKHLKMIPTEAWYYNLKDIDDDAGSDGKNVPDYVFHVGDGWGVSPSPNEAYTINYKYFKVPTRLSVYTDTTTIPSRFDYIIVAAAMLIMNPFKTDTAAYDRLKVDFNGFIRDMTNQLLPNKDRIYNMRMNPGGGSYKTRMWTGRN